jgi:kynurenine formamidase
MRVLLSHQIRRDMPVYRFSPPLVIYGHRSIERGDYFNNYRVEIWNHHGTHIDGPNHVNSAWKCISEYPIDHFFFERPVLVDVEASDSDLIPPEALRGPLEQARDPDLVLIRTGWAEIRRRDPARYVSSNPGISPDAARFLLERFPGLRAVGFDNFSSGAIQHFPESKETHHILLDPEHPRSDRMIIEDLNLSPDLPAPKRVWAIPLLVEGIDSTWTTVVAEV